MADMRITLIIENDGGVLTAGNTIRLLPPLVIDEAEAQSLAAGVINLIRDFG